MILTLVLVFAWVSWVLFTFYTILQIIAIANMEEDEDFYSKPVFFATCIFPNIMFLITICCLTAVV